MEEDPLRHLFHGDTSLTQETDDSWLVSRASASEAGDRIKYHDVDKILKASERKLSMKDKRRPIITV